MSAPKRKLLDEWSCPACLETLADSIVPAVLNGCRPFAHVICMACATALLAQRAALCPECRAPFIEARPLAAFVDNDDPAVAEVLAKKARTMATLEQRVEALGIEDQLTKKRVLYRARKVEAALASVGFRDNRVRFSDLPEFEHDHVALTVKGAKRIMRLHPATAGELARRLSALTDSILPHLQSLFRGRCILRNGHHNRRHRQLYMAIVIDRVH